jgi:hypothetical protein
LTGAEAIASGAWGEAVVRVSVETVTGAIIPPILVSLDVAVVSAM